MNVPLISLPRFPLLCHLVYVFCPLAKLAVVQSKPVIAVSFSVSSNLSMCASVYASGVCQLTSAAHISASAFDIWPSGFLCHWSGTCYQTVFEIQCIPLRQFTACSENFSFLSQLPYRIVSGCLTLLGILKIC